MRKPKDCSGMVTSVCRFHDLGAGSPGRFRGNILNSRIKTLLKEHKFPNDKTLKE
jgi:hypothetical protein